MMRINSIIMGRERKMIGVVDVCEAWRLWKSILEII